MRSTRERVIHTLLFEILAIATVAPAVSWLTDAPLEDAGAFSLIVSVGAVAANYVWTMVFDRLVPTRRRGFWLRAAQAIGLEAIITSFTIPLLMVFTGAGFWKAVVLDIAGVGFFVLFGMVYNLAFDAVMLRIEKAQPVSSSAGTPS